VEWLTNRIEEEANKIIAEIEQLGGGTSGTGNQAGSSENLSVKIITYGKALTRVRE